MSVQFGKVVRLITLERFGPVIEKVVSFLFQYGTNPLFYIIKYTELPLSKVKESLCILIKYNLVEFVPNRNESVANYTLKPDRILLMLRYPKYNNLIKKQFGDETEMIVEEVLHRGYCTASELLLKVMERLRKTKEEPVSFSQLKENFQSLVTAHYLQRMPYSKEDKPVPKLEILEHELYAMPEIDIKVLANIEAGNETIDNIPDKDVYWGANFDRFHQDMRDKIIVTAFTRKLDENAGEFVKLLLRQMYIRTQPWADLSNPVPILEIKDIVKRQDTHKELIAYFDQYVNVIEQDSSQIIRKAGEASGGSFQIFMKETFEKFAWETVEQMVLEKYDTKAARIFRLVKLKKYIEPDEIQRLAMIPAKEAKRLSYLLLEDNFLQVQELRKAASNNGPNKSFTLFHINLDQIVRTTLEHCYKSLFNIMTRKNHEKEVNKRIIVKKQRVDTIVMDMKEKGAEEDQIKDIEEMITPPEREILSRVEVTLNKLNIVEIELDETIFLLQMYLAYH